MNRLPDDKRLQFVPQDQRPPLTPQLALRVAMVGMFALALFAIIFFRLWFLQVLSGNQYLAQASVNRVRNLDIPSPRGQILDRNGAVMVSSTPVPAVVISPPDLPVPITTALLDHPPAADAAVYDRLGGILGIPKDRIKCQIPGAGVTHISTIACKVAKQYAALPYSTVTIKENVSKYIQYYLQERQDVFPGVSVEQVWLRKYPYKGLAAQLFGTVGPISPTELKEPHFRGAPRNAIVGQSGLEYYYDQYLRGHDGADRVQVDALGHFTGDLSEAPPTPGYSLKLSLDLNLQRVGQQALQQSIDSNYPANGGAFVAMNPQNGQVYAMGSLPTFDPNIFTGPIPESVYKQLNNSASNFPLINRAIQSAGPTGSTFKPITSVAAMQSGVWSPSDTYDDTGQFCVSGQCRHNAGGAVDGVLDIVNALRVSSDDFFYNLGALTNADPNSHPNGGSLQHWAHQLGIGQKTGIDLGGEVSGNLPSPKWRANIDKLEVECEKKRHVPSCGIADGRPWSIGDNINLAVGQGDVQATPLQLATAYSAIENGGTVVRPHIGLNVQDPDGTLRQQIDPPPSRHVNINPDYLSVIRAGLRAAASQPGGTSADVFSTFPEPVYGKTGTAQYNGQQDYSWYACFVPSSATRTPIVVVVWVEQGGFGAVASAPVARQILSQWFFGNPGKYVAGSSQTL